MNSSDALEPENPKTGTQDGQTETAKPRRWLAAALRAGLSITAILLLMLWILGSFRKDQIPPGKAAVPEKRADGLPTYTVAFTQIPGINEAVGTVRAEHIATVTSRVVGAILQVRVAAGQRIAKGEVLAELDDRDLRSRLEQAREAVRAAEATLSQARSDYRRDKPLFEQRVISAYDFEHTETNLKTAEANLDRLTQAQQEAEVNLSYAVIRSPFDGVVVDRLAEAGELAAPGRPLLTMYQEGRLWLEASVPEEQLSRVRLGQTYTVHIDDRDRVMRGRLVEVVPSSDPATRTVLARIRLEDTRDLLPGMFGRLLIPALPQQVLAIPEDAVRRVGQLAMVDAVRQGRVETRTVQLGRAIDGKVEVLSGLAPGEVIVAATGTAGRREAK